jgi:hypothetical protein
VTRRGTAPLELVLILPVLCGLVVTLYWIAGVGAGQVTALSEARGRAWQERDRAAPGEVLRFDHAAGASAVTATGSNPRLGHARTTTTTTHFRPWAHEDVPFPPLPGGEVRAHEEVLALLAARNLGPLSAASQQLAGLRAARAIDPATAGGR